jgi:histidinol-phosphate aminotransferase
LQGSSPIFKLDWNESTIPPSPKVQQSIVHHVTNGPGLNWYPELSSRSLLLALSDYTNVRPDQLMVTNGSDDALHLICSTFLDHDDEVVVPVPTYNHFVVFAQSKGAKIVPVQTENLFASNIEAIRDAMTHKTRLLYLVSPNNPTGVVAHPEMIEELCQDFPNTLIVLDEAYFEFSQVTGIGLVQRFPNLIVTRTFSKAFGLAGLRVGYLAAHPDILENLSRIYNPKSVNTLAQIGALAALSDLDYLNEYLDEVIESKRMLREFFAQRQGVEAWITAANFVVLRVSDVKDTLRQLEGLGVYVRDRSSYQGMEGCIRMTVGTVEQTQRLIDRLSKVFPER